MTDRELLELAAKAAGLVIYERGQASRDELLGRETASLWIVDGSTAWNPLTDDGDALRLAVTLDLIVQRGHAVCPTNPGTNYFSEHGEDKNSATRRAIVRAAAEIGRANSA